MRNIYILYYHYGENYDETEEMIGVFDSEEKVKEAMKEATIILKDESCVDSMGLTIKTMKLNELDREFV